MLHRCLGSVRVAASRSLTRSIASSSALCQAKKKKESSGPAAAAVESFDLKKQIPVNLLKGRRSVASLGAALSV